MTVPPHPAPFHPAVLDIAVTELTPLLVRPGQRLRVLDPFAGIGGIHELQQRLRCETTGVELLPHWAEAHERTIVGDATRLLVGWTSSFDAVVTSPCYGNRMADHHNAADVCKRCGGESVVDVEPGQRDHWHASRFGDRWVRRCPTCKGTGLSHRRSYRHYYGDGFDVAPAEVNAGAMQWGPEYRALHETAWGEVHRALRPGGLFLLDIKDHIRDKRRVRVSAWHRQAILGLGFVELGRWDIPTGGYRFGAHRERVPNEYVYVFERP